MSYTVTVTAGTTNAPIVWEPSNGTEIDISNLNIPVTATLTVTVNPNAYHVGETKNDGTRFTKLEMEDGPGGGKN